MKQRYALTNPIAPMLGKTREDFTREDLIRVIEEKNIEKITLHYVALDGQLKELKIPFANRYQAERILADGERVDGSSLYKGVVKDTFANFKHLRKTRHTHNPLDDARGNAEALLQIQQEYGLKINLR